MELENDKREEEMIGKARATRQENQETIMTLKEQIEGLNEELSARDQYQRQLNDEITRLQDTLYMQYQIKPV